MTAHLYNSALKGLATFLGGDLLLKLLGAAAAVITLAELDPTQYGLWTLLLSVLTAFAVVSIPGIASMLVADVSRELGEGNTKRANSILVRSVSLFVFMGAIGGVTLYVAAPWIRDITGINLVFPMQLLGLSVFALGIRQGYQLFFQSRLKFFHSQAMKVLDRFAYFIAIVVLVGFMDLGLNGVVYAYVISSVSSAVLLFPFIVPHYFSAFRNQEESHQPFLEAAKGRGKWIVASDTIAGIIGSATPWIIGRFLGIEAVGLFGVATLMLGQAASLVPIAGVLRSVLPRTADEPDRFREWLTRSMKFTVWGNALSGLAFFGVALVAFPLFFPHHLPAVPLYAALMASLPLRSVAVTALEWFYALKKQKDLFFVSSVQKLLNLILLPGFLWLGGFVGYVLWYYTTSIIGLFVRVKTVMEREGMRFSWTNLVTLDAEDSRLVERAIAVGRSKIVGFLK